MRFPVVLFACIVGAFLLHAAAGAQQLPPVHRIGIVFDGPWERNREIRDQMNREITDALGGTQSGEVAVTKMLVGDWTPAQSARLNGELLADPDIDLVIGFGVFSSHDLATRPSLPKPVIAPIVVDPGRQRIPQRLGTSGVRNLNYLIYPQTFTRDCALMKELFSFRKLVMLTSRRYHEGIPKTRLTDADLARLIGAEFVSVKYDDRADDALSRIPADADAVYLDFVPLPSSEFTKLSEGLVARRLPSFSLAGETEVRRGIMASANPDIFPRLIRRIALNVHRIVQGEDPGTLSVYFPAGRRLFLNMKTAVAVGISPNWTTMLEAEIVQFDSSEAVNVQTFSLGSAVQRIIVQNPDVRAKAHEVAAAGKNVGIARSALLPNIDISATGLQIDKDRALAGMQPERRASADVTVSQVIFAEPALANLSIQSSLQASKENELELSRLNSVVDGTTLFLNVVRTRRAYYIMLDNLKLTRSNLELAQVRQSSGSAGPEEPLRWEVQIASLRKSVMDIQSAQNQAVLALKQTMDIPLVVPVAIEEVSLSDTALFISSPKLLSYLDNPISFGVLTDVMVGEGIARSHEIRALDAAIEAQERNITSLRNSLFMPTLVAFGSYTNTFAKSVIQSPYNLTGMPAPPASLPPELPLYLGQLFSAITPQMPDRHDWSIGLKASLTLFQGFSTVLKKEQAVEMMNGYMVQREALREKIALRVRAQMESLNAAHFGIEQSRLAQQAAARGLSLVTDAYSQGAVSILSLLDAQNASLNSDLVAANAFYDFLGAYFQLERAIGEFDLLMTPAERHAVLSRIVAATETALRR